jgi:hypothetical protein
LVFQRDMLNVRMLRGLRFALTTRELESNK